MEHGAGRDTPSEGLPPGSRATDMHCVNARPYLRYLFVVGASLLVPGVAHLRLGAAVNGLAFLFVTAVLSTIQFGAPFVEPAARAALCSGVAFGLGWLVSLVAARSAARLVRT